MEKLQIESGFEGGNGRLIAVSSDTADIEIVPDKDAAWSQWFSFKLCGAKGRAVTVRIRNAQATTYPEGWPDYRVFASEDGENWQRMDTDYVDGCLILRCRPEADALWFAYFVPYQLARLEALLDFARRQGAAVTCLGRSFEDRPVHCVSIGRGPVPVWIVARQHAGETMASWWVEGFVRRLLSSDPLAAQLLSEMRFHIVPLVNIDGAVRGHLRGSASGVDLNRQWETPDLERAPEVAAIVAAMTRLGCAAVLDIHGDEVIPHVFADGCDVAPGATVEQCAGVRRFKEALLKSSSVFQVAVGYPASYAGSGAQAMCARAVAARFDAVGITLEMPFRDCRECRPGDAWSADTAVQFGHDCLPAVAAIFGLSSQFG